MKKQWTLKLCVPLASAAILGACNSGQDRTAIDHPTEQQRAHQEMTVTGCLSTGTGTNQYMLTAVQLPSLGAQPSDAPSTENNPITPDSQVRLAMADTDQLDGLVGQKVTVTGRISDDGRNTIGTTGQPAPGHTPASGEMEPRDDKSQAASSEHYSEKVAKEAGPIGQQSMNNGTFPEITVSKVNGTGETCTTMPTTERR